MLHPDKIIVVDGNDDNRSLLLFMLAEHGYDVVSASSGVEWLEMIIIRITRLDAGGYHDAEYGRL
jgi:CheY-like chemotaxis protein